MGFKPHAEQCRPERAALLCAFHRGEVCPRGVCGEWCAGPQEGADKGQEAPDRGRRFCKALCVSEELTRTEELTISTHLNMLKYMQPVPHRRPCKMLQVRST